MLKTPCYDLQFAENMLKLMRDEELYKKTAKDALDWAMGLNWDNRGARGRTIGHNKTGIGDFLNARLSI
jgi:hypothetical protein